MLKGKRKIVYTVISTFIVLTGIFTVKNNYFLLSDNQVEEGFPYVQYIKNAVNVFTGDEKHEGVFHIVFTDN